MSRVSARERLSKYGFVIPAKTGIQDVQVVTGSPPSRGRFNQKLPECQRGFAMYAIVLVLTILGTTLIAAFVSSSAIRYETEARNSAMLSQAKQALIGWALSRTAGADRPGDLPVPDSNSDSNYDGYTDTGCMDASKPNGLPLILTGTNVRCLGRLPWASLKMAISLPSQEDTQGMMPWYAVSANLTHLDTCLTVLNSETTNWPYSSFLCASGSNLPYPWLTVRDSRGNILSNRVAFVVIIPGQTLTGQQRPRSPNLAGPSQYLDTVTVPVGCAAPCVPGTYSNTDFDNDFILGEPTDTFNDRLIFVTIEDLMVEVEKRVAAEAKAAIVNFNLNYSTYPWLASFTDPTQQANFLAVPGVNRGLLPYNEAGTSFNTPFTWSLSGSYSSSHSGTVTLSDIDSGSVTTSQGACTPNSSGINVIDCTATVIAPKGGVTSRVISISYTGSSATYILSANPTSSNLVVSPATATNVTTRSVRRTTLPFSLVLQITDYNGASNVGTGWACCGGSIRTWGIYLYPVLPDWYIANNWQQFIYAAIAPGYVPGGASNCSAPSSCFTIQTNGVDREINLKGIVLTTGRTLNATDYLNLAGPPDPPQTRPNGSLYNYLDSANNVNAATLIFDRSQPLTATFNDQVVGIP